MVTMVTSGSNVLQETMGGYKVALTGFPVHIYSNSIVKLSHRNHYIRVVFHIQGHLADVCPARKYQEIDHICKKREYIN